VNNGDMIEIDIPNRTINVLLTDDELQARRTQVEASAKPYQPLERVREVSTSLKIFAMMATSADKGAVRDPSKIKY